MTLFTPGYGGKYYLKEISIKWKYRHDKYFTRLHILMLSLKCPSNYHRCYILFGQRCCLDYVLMKTILSYPTIYYFENILLFSGSRQSVTNEGREKDKLVMMKAKTVFTAILFSRLLQSGKERFKATRK